MKQGTLLSNMQGTIKVRYGTFYTGKIASYFVYNVNGKLSMK